MGTLRSLRRALGVTFSAALVLLAGSGCMQELHRMALGGSGQVYPPTRKAIRAARPYCPEERFPVPATRLVLYQQDVRRADPLLDDALGPDRPEFKGPFGEVRGVYWITFRAARETPLTEGCHVFLDGVTLRKWAVFVPSGI